ncbi:reverse transcriptase domain-containing protein, partial [Tanacetum coccineum]
MGVEMVVVMVLVAVEIWKMVSMWWDIGDSPKDLQSLITWSDSVNLTYLEKTCFDVIIQTTTWILWRYRNMICFDEKPPSKDSLAMSNQEAGGLGSGTKRTRTYIPREREEAEQRLIDDYFCDDKTPPKYPKEKFMRSYRMSSTFLAKIVNGITSYDAQPLPGVPGANNDLNVLYGSLLFDDVLADTAPKAPFVVNGRTYKKGYYLANGIYPTWSTFVKTFSIARDEKTLKFKRVQESARKDIERAFGEPELFGDDALPCPLGVQRIAKSQRSSNSTPSSGSNPTMFQEMLQQQYELDRKEKMERIDRE